MSTSDFRIDSTGFTTQCLRAYLASMQPIGSKPELKADAGYRRGRSLIQHLARSVSGASAPTLKFSADECVDVLHFMGMSEPIEPTHWWGGPKIVSNQASGFQTLLSTLARSL